MSAPTKEEVLRRYRRCLSDGQKEHDRLVKHTAECYAAYAADSIQGQDFANLAKVWGEHPPEIAIVLSMVNTFWSSLVAARRAPTFPGFDQGGADEVVGEMLTMLVDAGRRWAGSDAVDEAALMDQILSGYGFAFQTLETQARPPYRSKEQHLTADRVWWDAGSREKNLKDGLEWIVRMPYAIDEAAATWPEHKDTIKALGRDLGASGGGKEAAPLEGARSLGGNVMSVSVSAADGSNTAASGDDRKRLREVPVDDFEFVHFEQLVQFDAPGGTKVEMVAEEFGPAMEKLEKTMLSAGMPFERPAHVAYAQGTWYRVPILAASPIGRPVVLKDPEPIPGNQPLVRGLTGYPELYKDGESLRRRYFGWGKVFLGLQRLACVAIRLEIEEAARRNRSGADVESDAFDSPTEFDEYVAARAIPGSVRKVKPGALDKIHENVNNGGTRVQSMKELFQFLAVDLPRYLVGIGPIQQGTFEGDRSARFLTTMQETSVEMQTVFTTAYTDYLSLGAVTMARLLLLNLDAQDIDRLLGANGAVPREGVNAQKDPETGELVPAGTTGEFLKAKVGELFTWDVGFALRPSAPSERLANAALTTQHGFWESMLKAGAPPEIILPGALKGSFAQGTTFADMATQLEAHYAKVAEQQAEQAKVATTEGWLAFISQLAETDFDQAASLMQQASEAVTGPQAAEPS